MKIQIVKMMWGMKINKLIILFTLSIWSINSSLAQGFDYMVQLPSTNAKGFHKIIIAPAISAELANNFTDFRLFNAQKKEVPYILRKDFIRKHHQTFVPYKLIAKSTPGDTATEIIVENQFNTKINNLCLFLNNAEVSKQIIISGSYNQKQWYAVKQNYNISGVANQNNVTELNTIYFPLSDYNFYKILINDKNSLPVKVVQAGYYQDSTSYGEETLLKTPQIIRSEKTEEHLSLIQLNFDGNYAIDKINLKISAPTLYQRPIKIYALRNSNGKPYKEYLQETTLQTGANNQIILDNVHASQLILEIYNDNNPLLQIDKIACYQLSQYIIAFLEEKGTYTLKFGNKMLLQPVYDLAYFENIIPANIPVIETRNLSIINNPDQPVTKTIQPAYYNKKFFLWTAIIAVTLLLMLITGRMLNEMNKKNK
jgi:hypothetical protein